jgi:hypothetical protein
VLSCLVVSHRAAQALDRSPVGCKVPGSADLLCCGRPGSLMDRIFHGEAHPCQSNHDDYACSRGGVPMSGVDRMDSSTRVPICQVRVDYCVLRPVIC